MVLIVRYLSYGTYHTVLIVWYVSYGTYRMALIGMVLTGGGVGTFATGVGSVISIALASFDGLVAANAFDSSAISTAFASFDGLVAANEFDDFEGAACLDTDGASAALGMDVPVVTPSADDHFFLSERVALFLPEASPHFLTVLKYFGCATTPERSWTASA